MQILSALFLVLGAVICLLAAVGILRLPDFFMRMHAATKAGVSGCGLILIGVAIAEPSISMFLKVAAAIVFLLLTTPIAGHLLARAGYRAGVPLWHGTTVDDLEVELGRGNFELFSRVEETNDQLTQETKFTEFNRTEENHKSPLNETKPYNPKIRRISTMLHATNNAMHTAFITEITVTLASGINTKATIDQAILLAKIHRVPVIGLAIIDTIILQQAGPLPLGRLPYFSGRKCPSVEQARASLADVVDLFEKLAGSAGVPYSIFMEEGNPAKIISSKIKDETVVLIGRHDWFDQGIISTHDDALGHLTLRGAYPLLSVNSTVTSVKTVQFVHDGSPHSNQTLLWWDKINLWPTASLKITPHPGVRPEAVRQVLPHLKNLNSDEGNIAAKKMGDKIDVMVFGNEGHTGWINKARRADLEAISHIPIIVYG